MSHESRTRQLLYKRLRLGHRSANLVQLLRRALQTGFRSAGSREEQASDTLRRLLNRHRFLGECLVAELVQYESGKSPLAFEPSPDGESHPVRPVSLSDGEGLQLVDSTAYLCIAEDHTLLLASHGFGAAQAQDYLSWLVRQVRGDDVELEFLEFPSRKLLVLAVAGDHVAQVNVGNTHGSGNASRRLGKLGIEAETGNLLHHVPRSILDKANWINVGDWIKVSKRMSVLHGNPGSIVKERSHLIRLLSRYSSVPEEHMSLITQNGKEIHGSEAKLKMEAEISYNLGNVDFDAIVTLLAGAMSEVKEIVKR